MKVYFNKDMNEYNEIWLEGEVRMVFFLVNFMLINKKISIRKVQKKDVDFLYDLENDIKLWKVSQTKQKFTKKEISDFVYTRNVLILQLLHKFVLLLI